MATTMFLAESRGLDLLRSALGTANAPETYAVGNAHGEGFLIMEWIDTGDKHNGLHQEALAGFWLPCIVTMPTPTG